MAMYVDGVMVQSADIGHDWTDTYSFQVPLPVAQNHTAPSLLLGFRVINRSGPDVGLIVAAQVDYESGDPDIFYTGLDDSWRGEKVYDEGWEQPWFNSDSWDHVTIVPHDVRSPSQDLLSPTDVVVFNALPVDTAPGVCSTSGSAHRGSISFSAGAFAGVLVGSILAAVVVGALGCYLVLRRQCGATRTWPHSLDSGGVATPPQMAEVANLPQEPQPSRPSRSASYEEYGPISAVSSQQAPNPSSNATLPSSYLGPAAELAPPTYTESSVTTSGRSNVKSTPSSVA
ncbi:hypothetical protein FA13DRAFT_1726983 [Coprinellus micaceus]|uniref:Uncharacterized protein n=1 Tax=Coprinellus micaceus TaxID=71717 RepID=A0A4Y7TR01_COPMI|nr:hypothetical protein FA13DRAFT_1726983 [Coprinellus micaceus]